MMFSMLANSLRTPLLEQHDTPLPQPFVGVCGVRSQADYDMLADYAPDILEGTSAFIMAGVKDPTVRIGHVCLSPLVKPFVHSDYQPSEHYLTTTERVIEQTHDYAQGLQLNVLPWMDTSYRPVLAALKQRYPHLKLILQAHRRLMEQHTPEAVAQELATLPVDYILFDPSQSKGEPYNVETMHAFAATARHFAPWIGTAVAGGLGGRYSMATHYAPIARKLHPVNCDAFGQLQTSTGQQLDWTVVEQYLWDWRQVTTRVRETDKTLGGPCTVSF